MRDTAFAINHFLRQNGFASLAEAGPLISQLAFCVRGEHHFRSLINACEPEDRRDMYEAMVPNLPTALRGKVKALDVYVAEMAMDAEIRQLPTVGPNGELVAFKPAIAYDQDVAPGVVAKVFEKEPPAAPVSRQRIHVVCTLCTREDWFTGLTEDDVIHELRAAGWRHAMKLVAGVRVATEVCPKCVAKRKPAARRIHSA